MSNQRRHPRIPLKCRIKISHESFGELIAQTRDLSDGGVFIRHPQMVGLAIGTLISGQSALLYQIVPASGGDELAGITGELKLDVIEGIHHYALSYELP